MLTAFVQWLSFGAYIVVTGVWIVDVEFQKNSGV